MARRRQRPDKAWIVAMTTILGYFASLTVFTLILNRINSVGIVFSMLFSAVSGLVAAVVLSGRPGLSLTLGLHGSFFVSLYAVGFVLKDVKLADPHVFLISMIAAFISSSYVYSFVLALSAAYFPKCEHEPGSQLYIHCSEKRRLGARPLDLCGLRIWIAPIPLPYRSYDLRTRSLGAQEAGAKLETIAWYLTALVQMAVILMIFLPLASAPYMSCTILTTIICFIFITLQRKVRDSVTRHPNPASNRQLKSGHLR